MSFKKEVELIAWLQNLEKGWGAEDPAVMGARGCRSEQSSLNIHAKDILQENYIEKKEATIRETSGRGHGAVLDQSAFLFSIDNLTRASTLFLCGPEYGVHLQQSLRTATAERGFEPLTTERGFEPLTEEEGNEIMQAQFDLYGKMQDANIPAEDARYILPLNTKTTIQTLWNARELMHLHSMANRPGIPHEVKDTVNQMYEQVREIAPRLMKDRGTNYEVLAWFPSSQIFGTENKTIERLVRDKVDPSEPVTLLDYSGKDLMTAEEIKQAVEERDEVGLANMKQLHFTFLAPMSLASFHQATRQRTWNQSVEPLADAVKRGKYVVPPKIKGTEFEDAYNKLTLSSIEFAKNGGFERLGVLPHTLQVYDMVHMNGWNAIHSLGKRTCMEAQWEIRATAQSMAKHIREINPGLGVYAVPQGKLYGKCPEGKPCGECFREE